MATGTLSPYAFAQFCNNSGVPLAAGLLYTYEAGTTTPATTYLDSTLTVGNQNTNPIILDSGGRCTIYLDASSYKYILTDGVGYNALIPVSVVQGVVIDTQDNVQSTAVGQSGGLGEIYFMGGDFSSPITLTSYPSGATVDKLHIGSGIYSVDSADLPGTYSLQAMLIGNGGTVTLALVNLSDGAPDTPLVTITSTSTTGELKTSSSITFAASGTSKSYGIKAKVSAGFGLAWSAKITRTA